MGMESKEQVTAILLVQTLSALGCHWGWAVVCLQQYQKMDHLSQHK